MKLITETIENLEILVEERGGKKQRYIKGIFLQTEVKNRNGRVYRKECMEREVKRYSEQYIKSGRALGELGHPDGPGINLDRVSHSIVELIPEGNNFIGKAKILETPMGKIASSLLDEGVKLGVSSRGMGSLVERDGVKYVADDFMLATAADIVADPSAPDAFVEGIMEGKEWVWEGGLLREKTATKIKKKINESAKVRQNKVINKKKLDEHKIRLFYDFLANI